MCDLRNIDVETVSDIVVEAEYMLVSHNFAPERANQTYFKISVILLCYIEINASQKRRMMRRVEENDPAAMTHAGVKQRHTKGNYSGASKYWKAGCVSKEDLAMALRA